MGTIIRRNERSWAIVIISEIRNLLQNLNKEHLWISVLRGCF